MFIFVTLCGSNLLITLLKNLFSASLPPQTLGVFAFNYMKYIDKLKNPKWQKKRLEILNRDEFKCRGCGNDEKTLHVHHLDYQNVEPWEYENRNLITLCESCHESEEFLKPFTASSVEYLTMLGFLRKDIADVVMHISNKVDTMNDVDTYNYFKNLVKIIKNG